MYEKTAENNEYKSQQNIMYSCKYHVVWCPKYRRKVLAGEIKRRLEDVIARTCEQMDADLMGMEIRPDRVHLILDVDPRFGIHRAVKTIKRNTSRILRGEFKELTTKLPTLWSHSYFLATVGGISDEAIEEYISSQKTSERKTQGAGGRTQIPKQSAHRAEKTG